MMKLIAAAVLSLATMLAVPTVSLAVDASISANCRSGAPKVYSRPGGFCEQVASNKSLADTGGKLYCPEGTVEINNVCVPE